MGRHNTARLFDTVISASVMHTTSFDAK
ncbi:hypothetical protein CCACVL1_26572 [Corchorus capsularis]|uniref:Uncharacterized protein n=1 Tax=Corchorus capsularis TaxID=210143 RepID=A0A1R3GEA5_COCAP|nr:hypothetical protein CCACVL1_26572 [Corchorus capsularis]